MWELQVRRHAFMPKQWQPFAPQKTNSDVMRRMPLFTLQLTRLN